MRGKLWFLGGAAVGFVIGARAGRERYDQLVSAARQLRDHPTVQEAAGVVQEQANRLYAQGKDTVADKLSHSKLGERFRQQPESGLGGELEESPEGDSLAGTAQRPPGSTY
jgi:hypothetical protein